MSIHRPFPFCLAALAAIAAGAAPKIVFVVPGGTGDGSSWADAMGNVSNAYAAAAAYAQGGFDSGEVWIKTGRYTVAETIEMQSGVAVRGGFLGTETDASAASRDNLTILSGDRNNDDFWKPCGTNTTPVLYVWTGDDKMTFNPPNPDGAATYWDVAKGSGNNYGGFTRTSGAVTNGVFTDLTFTSFGNYAVYAKEGAIDFAFTNCSFLACTPGGYWTVHLASDSEAIFHNCVFQGGHGLRVDVGAVEVRTNRFVNCVFRDIMNTALYLASGSSINGHNFQFENCRFFRNYTAMGSHAVGVYFGQGTSSRNEYNFMDCVFEDCRMAGDAVGVFNSSGNYGYSPHVFERCHFVGNTNKATTTGSVSAVFTGRNVSGYWLFRDCSFLENTLLYNGTGRAASIYANLSANNYALFLNCTLARNAVIPTGDSEALSLGTIVGYSPHCRIFMVNSLLCDNFVAGKAAVVGDFAENGSGSNSHLQIINSIFENSSPDYVPLAVTADVKPYLLANFMRGFDPATAGCTTFARNANVTSNGESRLSAFVRRSPDSVSVAKGATPFSPFWRGGIDIHYSENPSTGIALLYYDPAFNGTRLPWRQLHLPGGGNFSDVEAANLGITLDSPLLPDALGHPRKAGKVAYGPLGYAYPTVLRVR